MRVVFACVESHVGILDRNGGAKAVTAKLRGAGCVLADNTAVSWVIRDAIPRAYWRKFEELGLATQDELERCYQLRRERRAEIRRQATGAEL
jgi:hypothetical protein